ncbi:hypothetical protein P5673_005080 [Acropora cervicornis]|uniref:Uncharacterized protein n=1 Tax=Acropora cervicornis TaxID=6130 RepID=A0AAD9QZC5_ACRCE|nr:hypothetical protein P5673_005080 [Acropora cervicornis]
MHKNLHSVRKPACQKSTAVSLRALTLSLKISSYSFYSLHCGVLFCSIEEFVKHLKFKATILNETLESLFNLTAENKMPFEWPSSCQDVMLATELAQRRPKCPADYEQIARVLSPIFSEDKKPVVLSGRACREKMNGLISEYLEEDKDFT